MQFGSYTGRGDRRNSMINLYSTWSIRNFIVESRWILIAMYNILLFLALLATLFATVRDLDDDLLFNIMSPFILLSTTTIVVAVYAPSVLKGKITCFIILTKNRNEIDRFHKFKFWFKSHQN